MIHFSKWIVVRIAIIYLGLIHKFCPYTLIPLYTIRSIIYWLVVWLTFFIFPHIYIYIYGMSSHPNWRAHIFQRGFSPGPATRSDPLYKWGIIPFGSPKTISLQQTSAEVALWLAIALAMVPSHSRCCKKHHHLVILVLDEMGNRWGIYDIYIDIHRVSIYLSIYLPIYLSIDLSIDLSIQIWRFPESCGYPKIIHVIVCYELEKQWFGAAIF